MCACVGMRACVHVYACVCMGSLMSAGALRGQEVLNSPGVELTGSCESPNMDMGTQTPVLWKSNKCSLHSLSQLLRRIRAQTVLCDGHH